MEQTGYQNYYIDVDSAIGKTIRYRQMMGLIASSSIRSFRTQPTNLETTTQQQQQLDQIDSAKEVVFDIPTSHSHNESITSNRENSAASNPLPTYGINVGNDLLSTATNTNRRSKRKNIPAAVDVIHYLFHNNNHIDCDTVKNADTHTLSDMKVQEQTRKAACHKNFNTQFQHPGYIPAALWCNFTQGEQDQKSIAQSTTQSTNKETIKQKEILPEVHHENSQLVDFGDLHLQYMPVCFDCGGVIQPGVMNTTIRMVELKHNMNAVEIPPADTTIATVDRQSPSSKSKRRRESRFKAKLCRTQYYGSKLLSTCPGSHQKSQQQQQQQQPDSKSNLWKYIWLQQNQYYHTSKNKKGLKSIYPFLNCGTHYYIVTCGSCGAQIHLPDFQENNATLTNIRNKKITAKMNQLERNKSAWQNQKSGKGMKHEAVTKLPVSLPGENNSVNNIVKDHDDRTTSHSPEIVFSPSVYVAPMDSSNSTNATGTIGIKRKELPVTDVQPQAQSQSLKTIPATTLLQQQRKKKKKSKNAHGKNDLMSFLSSLNDR
jgi:hypothetical protein